MMMPIVGPKVLGQSDGRYLRWIDQWAGHGFARSESETQLYLGQLQDPVKARAQSDWYRTFNAREIVPIFRGRYTEQKVTVPVRFVTGMDDPVIGVIGPNLHRWYADVMLDCELETVPGVGHWIVEQAPDLTLERLRRLMRL